MAVPRQKVDRMGEKSHERGFQVGFKGTFEGVWILFLFFLLSLNVVDVCFLIVEVGFAEEREKLFYK